MSRVNLVVDMQPSWRDYLQTCKRILCVLLLVGLAGLSLGMLADWWEAKSAVGLAYITIPWLVLLLWSPQ